MKSYIVEIYVGLKVGVKWPLGAVPRPRANPEELSSLSRCAREVRPRCHKNAFWYGSTLRAPAPRTLAF